jgi:diketogulonate reductase-like aldo/keto reductase
MIKISTKFNTLGIDRKRIPMENAQLANGVRMPMLGLGVYDMYEAEAERAVHDALAIGYRLIDTAEMYRNEAEIGRAVRTSGILREDIFITTKIANPSQGFDATLRAFEISLQKLQTDYIDLYLVHWPIRETRKDTWKALERIYREKRARAIGVANYYGPHLDDLYTYAEIRPMVNQVEFSPYLQLPDLQVRCQQDGILMQAYTPLARGKRLDDARLVAIADKHGKTPAQVMLRWILQQGVCPIPKSVSRKRLEENFDVFDFILDAADLPAMAAFDEGLRVCEDPMDYL